MEGQGYAQLAVNAVREGEKAYCKFLAANDTGVTGAHQEGIYITKSSCEILFDAPGTRGENRERLVRIHWQNSFYTDSRFVYYGKGSRNEYRITRFGRGFPLLRPEHTGDLFVLVQQSAADYAAYVLQTEEEINQFLDEFGMSPSDTGGLLNSESTFMEQRLAPFVKQYLETLHVDFPSSAQMSLTARQIYGQAYPDKGDAAKDPDRALVDWTGVEYVLFRALEYSRYGPLINGGFPSVEQFIEVANMVLNRRKSRAGKSLENHLSAVFDANGLQYEAQARTEANKRPDFLFPDAFCYRNYQWPDDKLVFLGAKTTCKDRWRQILNEANRIPVKHLFTLQQGISAQQLDEMEEEGVVLVVPRTYITAYPKEKRESIWTLERFIQYVREIQSS